VRIKVDVQNAKEDQPNNPLEIVDVIYGLTKRESNKFSDCDRCHGKQFDGTSQLCSDRGITGKSWGKLWLVKIGHDIKFGSDKPVRP